MRPPLRVVIVGGGTAGWMTAAALAGILKPGMAEVRLVESDEIGTVGVGEATLPQMRAFNDAVGLIEADMMRRTGATFKLGIEFVDWGFRGSSYVHPFGAHGTPVGGVAFHHQWLRAKQAGHAWPVEDFSYAIAAARANRFDFPAEPGAGLSATYDYAYHFDAFLYAQYLRAFAERRGVTRTEGKVTDVALHPERGDIASITLASGEAVAGDFFIDCTGFRALLIGGALGGGFEDWSQWLPCDRALAVPSATLDTIEPYTRSTARDAGWQWRIPLQHRTGNGYIFASAFTDRDRAAETLMAQLPSAALGEPRLLSFTAGRRRASWRRNCLAVGLSSGFLEPLESTSIYLIQQAILFFLRLLPTADVDPALAGEFNRLMDIEYERIRDFLILHYHLNQRDDAELWRYCQAMPVPDSLVERIELFRHRGHIAQYKDGLFTLPSWLSVFLGQGLEPERYHPMANAMPLPEVLATMGDWRSAIRTGVAGMSAHDDFLSDYCPARVEPRTPMRAGIE